MFHIQTALSAVFHLFMLPCFSFYLTTFHTEQPTLWCTYLLYLFILGGNQEKVKNNNNNEKIFVFGNVL